MTQMTISVDEASTILGVCRMTVYNAVNRGEIPAIRVGKRILVLRSVIEEMLQVSQPLAVAAR